MTTKPAPSRATKPAVRQTRRSTPQSQRVADYAARNNLRPVSWYVPVGLHAALQQLTHKAKAASGAAEATSLQAVVTAACAKAYGLGPKGGTPPLAAPTNTALEPHKRFTWYAPYELQKDMRLVAANIESSMQQLVTSAVVDYLKDQPEIAALRIPTGVPPFMRAPDVGSADFSDFVPPAPRVKSKARG